MTALPNNSTGKSKYDLTLLELFFDLVFAFAVSQLSQHLLLHLSWHGAAETLVLLLTVLTVWSYTSWAVTMIHSAVARTGGLLLSVMLLGLFMNASITRAFTTSGWAFVIPLLLIQLGRTLWTILRAPDAGNREHYVRVLVWFLFTTPLWITGAAGNAESRALWWGAAAGLELIATWFAHPIPGRRLQSENVAFDGDHMLERCRMFLLIALGETVLTTGTAISQSPLTLMTLVTGTSAFVGTTALWGLSFGRAHTLILRHLEETCDPIRASRHAVNVLMILVTGLIAVAVANKMVIASPQSLANGAALNLMLFGGPILFLLAQSWYLRTVLHVSPRLPLIGSASLLIGGLVTWRTPPYVALVVASAVLVIIVLFDQSAITRDHDQEENSQDGTQANQPR